MTTKHEQMPAIDALLREVWFDPMRAFADAALAAREDVERRGWVHDRMLLLAQQNVVVHLADRRCVVRQSAWLGLAVVDGAWHHVRLAGAALVARYEIAAVLIVRMRGERGARSLCLALERPAEEPLHLRADVAASGATFGVSDFARTWHPWAADMSLLAPASHRDDHSTSTTARGRASRKPSRAHLRVIRGGRR